MWSTKVDVILVCLGASTLLRVEALEQIGVVRPDLVQRDARGDAAAPVD